MSPFYVWGSTVSKLQSHYKETIYFLPFIGNLCYFVENMFRRESQKVTKTIFLTKIILQ